MVALRLVQEGKIDLDRDINEVLVNWKLPQNRFTAQTPVSLKHLLSHTGGVTVSGFPGYRESDGVPSVVTVLQGRSGDCASLVTRRRLGLTGCPNTDPIVVDTTPGSIWRYSGGGYTVMQQAVADVEGREFPEIARDRVLDPIGMVHSTYEQPIPSALLPRAAAGHYGNGRQIRERRHVYPEMAAAGLWTTPSDLARFAIEIQLSRDGRANRVLSQEMTELMLTPFVADDYGLGLSLVEGTFGHGGSNAGFKCRLQASLGRGFGVVVMTNGDRGSSLAAEIVAAVVSEYGGW
jgi:CubicO group peptidase (beta-lactamase class C family)